MGIYEVVKDAVNVAQKADNIELVQKLLEVQKMALDLQEKQQELNRKIESTEKENMFLKETLKKKGDFLLEQSAYWRKDDPNRNQPYCSSCMGKQLVMPMRPSKPGTKRTRYYCPNPDCDNYIDLGEPVPEALYDQFYHSDRF